MPKSGLCAPVDRKFGELRKVQTVDGECFYSEDVNELLVTNINNSDIFFKTKDKKMSNQIDDATSATDKAMGFFNQKINQFFKLESDFISRSKKTTGDMRDTIQKMGDSLDKLEKTSNLDQLERRVALMERAASAMRELAELQATGKLDKILAAIK